MTRLPAGAGVLVLLLAGGCASAPPRTAPPIGVDTPAQWSGTTPADEAPDARWWQRFNDPTLERLVTEALDHNRSLLAAATRLDAAAAQARIAGASLLPSMGAGLNSGRRRQNFIGLPIPGAEDRVLSTVVTTHGVSLDTTWEADLWGRLRAGAAASLAEAQATQADVAAARLSIAAQTARTYFALIEAREQVALAESTLESYRTTVAQVRERFERGLRPSIDLRLALSNQHAAEATLEQRYEAHQHLRRQLEILLGRYPAGTLEAAGGLPQLPPAVPAGLPADLVARRPDLMAPERRLASADSRLVQDRRALYPSLSLTGSGGTSTNVLSGLLDGHFGVWYLLGGLVQPVFQAGRLRAQVNVSEARTREALELYAGSVLNAYAEVENALETETFLARRQTSLEATAEQALAARDLAESRYRAGVADFFTVLESQRRAVEAESQLLLIRRLRLDTRVDLHRALGGDFSAGAGAGVVRNADPPNDWRCVRLQADRPAVLSPEPCIEMREVLVKRVRGGAR
jgi:outer membrane protein, multidrug efflux system